MSTPAVVIRARKLLWGLVWAALPATLTAGGGTPAARPPNVVFTRDGVGVVQ